MRQDEGELLTERELAKLEKRIRQEYGAAQKEMADTITQYFADFAVRDEQMKKLIGTEQNGKTWTEADYRQWRLAQIGRGERFQALKRRIAERYTNARETAERYVNDATPGIYSLNRNYAAYTIEQVAGDVGFDFWDEQTVRRLLVEQPALMPHYPEKRAIKRGIDLAYGQRQIAASVTSGILQGKSLKAMADDLQQRIPEMSRNSALRAARTAVTGAQNAGRTDSYAAAEKMGVKTKRQWVATLDNRTRHEHGELDGQVVAVDEPFEVGGYSLMFPGDPSGPPHLIYNCRCRIKAVVEGHEQGGQRRARDPETGRNVLIENMSYAEWAGWKQEEKLPEITYAKTRNDAYDLLAKEVGFYEVSKSLDYISEDVIVAQTNQLLKLNQKFGAIGEDFGGYIGAESSKKFTAVTRGSFSNATSQNLVFSFDSFSHGIDFVAQETEKSIKINWSMPALKENYSIYTVTHEYGHILENVVMSKRIDLADYESKRRKLGTNIKALDKLKKETSTKAAKDIFSEITDIAKKNNPDFSLKSNISDYGKTNYQEAFAEIFANSQLGEPNELGKAMNVWLERNGLVKK